MGVENIRIGVCGVKFNNVDLGYTKGGVTVSIEVSTDPSQEIGSPEHYDHKVSSMGITIKCPLVEFTQENLLVAFPWATDNGQSLSVPSKTGQYLRSYAKVLEIIPVDTTLDKIVFPVAIPISQFDLDNKVDAENVISITFRALTTSRSDKTLMQFTPQTLREED